MKQHLLENGLKAVADYYLGCSKHVQASYERACRVVRKFYGEFGFEEYNPAHDDEIMNQVLAGRTLTPESSYMFCRYADTEMKRAAIEKATGQNHPLRSTETFIEEHLLDDDMIKKLYGLC